MRRATPSGDPINDGFKVGNGSVVKVAFEPIKYFVASSKTAGVSLRLRAVQIIKLVEFNGGGGDFFEEEEGYEIDDKKDNNGKNETGFEAETTDSEDGDY
jgi:hypothetical protein